MDHWSDFQQKRPCGPLDCNMNETFFSSAAMYNFCSRSFDAIWLISDFSRYWAKGNILIIDCEWGPLTCDFCHCSKDEKADGVCVQSAQKRQQCHVCWLPVEVLHSGNSLEQVRKHKSNHCIILLLFFSVIVFSNNFNLEEFWEARSSCLNYFQRVLLVDPGRIA